MGGYTIRRNRALGASEAGFTASVLGIPSICSMGPEGAELHSRLPPFRPPGRFPPPAYRFAHPGSPRFPGSSPSCPMRRQSVARLMPGSLAAAFFPSVCRRFQDGSLEAEHRFAFPGDAGETAAAGVLRQGFHPARPRPREPGHPADQLAFSAFMSNSMGR